MNLRRIASFVKESFLEGWNEAASAPKEKERQQSHKEEDSLFGLYFGVPYGLAIIWFIGVAAGISDLRSWWQNLPLTTAVFVFISSAVRISEQLDRRSKQKKKQKMRSTIAILADDSLLGEAAGINLITFQHAITQGLLVGIIGSSLTLALIYTYYFWVPTGMPAYYVLGLCLSSIASFFLLVQARLQAEKNAQLARYYQAATNCYLDRSAEIKSRYSQSERD